MPQCCTALRLASASRSKPSQRWARRQEGRVCTRRTSRAMDISWRLRSQSTCVSHEMTPTASAIVPSDARQSPAARPRDPCLAAPLVRHARRLNHRCAGEANHVMATPEPRIGQVAMAPEQTLRQKGRAPEASVPSEGRTDIRPWRGTGSARRHVDGPRLDTSAWRWPG